MKNPPIPEGRVRVHRVPLMMRVGRAVGKSTSLLTARPDNLFYPPPDKWEPLTDWVMNDVLYEWGALIGPLLLRQGLQYGIAGMYIEFMNVADPSDPVSLPVVTRDADQGIAYYDGLATSPDRDYLRVPLIGGVLNQSDPIKFPKGNVPTFFAQTTGVVGVHGKPFSDANNSKVYGGALVAFVDKLDATQDRIFSRFYLDAAKQQVKQPTSQIGLEWEEKLK